MSIADLMRKAEKAKKTAPAEQVDEVLQQEIVKEFAPPTTCAVCGTQGEAVCKTCGTAL